ncbi:hypothetical protein, partial [Schlesneria sp.]|uniref:hypothetical protein n=1 Tax=Schlesneria sp. TaxID=2762018 RepID=UPI002EF0B027
AADAHTTWVKPETINAVLEISSRGSSVRSPAPSRFVHVVFLLRYAPLNAQTLKGWPPGLPVSGKKLTLSKLNELSNIPV